VGFYGWFDSIDDQDVANALFQAAESWLRERKLERWTATLAELRAVLAA
jgi:hypothetical protein